MFFKLLIDRQSEINRLQKERDVLEERVRTLEQEKESRINESALSILREKAAALEIHHRESIQRCTELEFRCDDLERQLRAITEQYEEVVQ